MATYSTDLTTLTTAESGTWVDFAAPYDSGNPGASGEQFIQGTDCYSVNTGKNNGLEISAVFDNGSGVTFSTDDVVYMWCFYFAGTNLETYANSGWRIGIGSSVSAWDWFRVGGSDYSNHALGGWRNFAVDPTATQSGTIGGGNGGTYRYFGNVPYTINEVSKGDPVAVDAIRYGRGEISITGSSGSFSELAEYNDYNAGGTPPGTSSTSKDSGRHVLGIFQAAGGTYLFKGLLALGLSGTSVTFSDSNETIVLDDCPHTYAAFNKIEVRNASSTVTLTNVTVISTATTANGIGYFEMVDNATVSLIGCSFNDMGTFILDSNGTVTDTSFNSCGQVTAGSATFTGCVFNTSTSATSLLAGNNDMTSITGNTFTSDGSNHAVEINAVGTGSMTWSNTLTSYVAGTTGTNVTTGSTGNEAIYLNFTSAATYTINVSGGTTPSVRKGTGMTGNVDVVASVTVTLTGLRDTTEVRVMAAGSNTNELAGTDDATTGTTDDRSFAFSLSTGTSVDIYIVNKTYENIEIYSYSIPASATSLPQQQRFDRVYLNP